MTALRKRSIKIRVSDSEFEELTARKQGGQLASWMRDFCLGAVKKRPGKYPTVDPKLTRQLAGIGNNLNQLARKLNTRDDFDRLPMYQVLSALRNIEAQIEEIGRQHDSEIQ